MEQMYPAKKCNVCSTTYGEADPNEQHPATQKESEANYSMRICETDPNRRLAVGDCIESRTEPNELDTTSDEANYECTKAVNNC